MAENKEVVEIITLEFDDDTRMDCEILGIFDYDGKDYIALIPDDESDDVYIYGYEEDEDENFELIDITDDELFKKVAKEFEDIMNSQE